MKIIWLGHAAFLIEGTKKVLIDPFITGNPTSPVKPEDICPDIILVTHGHGDHLGDTIEISKRCGAPVICIHELSRYFSKKGVEAIGMNIGGTAELQRLKGVRATMVNALHSADIVENDDIISTGNPSGVVIEMDGVKIYHTGDTDVFLDMQLIGELHTPSIMLLPIGDWYTMGIKGAVKAIELVKPDIAIPMHYNTFPVVEQNPEEFKEAVAERGLKTEVVVLKPGESYKP